MADDIWERKYRAMAQSCDDLLKENIQLRERMAIMEAEKAQWLRDKINQQQIIQQALANSNQTNNSYLEENRRLQEELRALKEKK